MKRVYENFIELMFLVLFINFFEEKEDIEGMNYVINLSVFLKFSYLGNFIFGRYKFIFELIRLFL